MAIIDPDGLFCGERLAACSDIAQLYWPRFFLAANSCGRIELSFNSLVSRVFGNFHKVPESSQIWAVFREYEANFLAVLYESSAGSWWCQFATSEKFLPKYKKTRDELSPAPPLTLMEKHRAGYLEWKRSKCMSNQSFQKVPESFSSEGVGIGVGIGVGKRHSPANGKPSAECVVLYRAYPRHTAPAAAYKAIDKALQVKPFDDLLLAVQAFVRKCSRNGTEERYIPHPASWFNAGRYDDEEFKPGYRIQPNGAKTNGKGDQNIAALREFLETGYGPDGDGHAQGDDTGQLNLARLLPEAGKREN